MCVGKGNLGYTHIPTKYSWFLEGMDVIWMFNAAVYKKVYKIGIPGP